MRCITCKKESDSFQINYLRNELIHPLKYYIDICTDCAWRIIDKFGKKYPNIGNEIKNEYDNLIENAILEEKDINSWDISIYFLKYINKIFERYKRDRIYFERRDDLPKGGLEYMMNKSFIHIYVQKKLVNNDFYNLL